MSVPEQTGDSAPRRSRIVIDVGKARQQPSSATGARRGGFGAGKILLTIALVLGSIVAAAGLGGFLWYRSYKRTPAYSLARLTDAVQRNDTQEFDRIVDLDRITENFVPQIVERAAGRNEGSLLGAASGISGTMAQAVPGVRDQVREEFLRQAREVTARGANVPVFLIALAVPRMVDSITEEGETARVNLKIQERPVELSMQRITTDGDERWRIVAVRDDALAARIAGQLPQRVLPRQLPRQLPRRLPQRLPTNTDDLPFGGGADGDNETDGNDRSDGNNARRSSPSPSPRREQRRREPEGVLPGISDLPIPFGNNNSASGGGGRGRNGNNE